MIVVKHVDSIFGSLLPIRLSTFKLVTNEMGTLYIKDPLPFFRKSRLVIPVAGFAISSRRYSHIDLWRLWEECHDGK